MSLQTNKSQKIAFANLLVNLNFEFDCVEEGVIFLILEGECSEKEVREVYPYELDYLENNGLVYLSVYLTGV